MDIAVNRTSPVGAVRAMEKAKQRILDGKSVAIFPEGTIPPHPPALKRFKSGAFKLAIETGVPIVPITFLNNYKIFTDIGILTNRSLPGFANVLIHPSVSVKGKTEKI
jgi:1-acyl-sn-glycerol-3-phosphate acyltransferase